MSTKQTVNFSNPIIEIQQNTSLSTEAKLQSTDICLYTNPHSRGNTVLWLLEECEANYQVQLLHFKIETSSVAYRAINPLGKVPALVHNGHTLTETGAICSYIVDLFAHKNLKPDTDSAYLADYYRWLFFLTGTFDAAIIAKATQTLPSGIAIGMSSVGRFEDIETVINTALKQAKPYLCADQFTLADLIFASYLLFATRQAKVMPLTPAIERYLEPILVRPAFLKMIAFVEQHAPAYRTYIESV